MKAPPPLPEAVVARVIRLARLDGRGVVLVATISTLLTAVLRDYVGCVVGLLVTGAGLIEVHGATLLRQQDARGMKWLISSQLLLLVTILAYCFVSLQHPYNMAALQGLISADAKNQLDLLGWSVDDFIKLVYRLTYYSVAFATVLYQGGMAFYYLRRKPAVTAALGPPPPLPPGAR